VTIGARCKCNTPCTSAVNQSGLDLNVLLLTEHFPVITLGYRRMPEHLLLSPIELQKRGIAVVETERGGRGDLSRAGAGRRVSDFFFAVATSRSAEVRGRT